MPIRSTAASDLADARDTVARPPSRKPIVTPPISQEWYRQYLESGAAEYAPAIPELPYRASLTGMRCDRQLYYHMSDLEPSNPLSVADAWRFQLGHFIGDAVAASLDGLGAGWFAEWNVDLQPIGIAGSGHADVVEILCAECGEPMELAGAANDERNELGNPLLLCSADVKHYHYRVNTVVEVKSCNGFKFKLAATNFQGPPEGPDHGHILQAGLTALALDCDRIIVAYFGIENLSPDMAAQYSDGSEEARFSAEWHYSTTTMRAALDVEIARINRILRVHAAGRMPAREIHDDEIPPGGVVVRPGATRKETQAQVIVNGQVTWVGTSWRCGYCAFRDKCIEHGEVESDEVEI